ncbi:MAG: hypothetical protein IJL41_02375 [Clostridia bacterium]|nr:hypothetical protein [Clostridia bacterium]
MNKRILFSTILILLIVFIYCFGVFASDLDDIDANTTVSGWSLWTPYHMGSKDLTYSFASMNLYTTYYPYVSNGGNLWGTNINLTFTTDPSSACLVFTVGTLPDNSIAVMQIDSYDQTTGHVTI